MLVVKCNKCGEQINVRNFQRGDTIVCPSCTNAQSLRPIDYDVQVGSSRSHFQRLIWVFSWLVYSTGISYVTAETSFKIYNKTVTWVLTFVWMLAPLFVYLSVQNKRESKEKCQEDIERKKDFAREMLSEK